MTPNSNNQDRLTATRKHNPTPTPAADPARDHYNRAIEWLQRSEWQKAENDLSTAKRMGADIVALFQSRHGNIADYEEEANVRLPREIVAMLARSNAEKLRAAAGGWVGLNDAEEMKRMLYQARIDGSREPPVP